LEEVDVRGLLLDGLPQVVDVLLQPLRAVHDVVLLAAQHVELARLLVEEGDGLLGGDEARAQVGQPVAVAGGAVRADHAQRLAQRGEVLGRAGEPRQHGLDARPGLLRLVADLQARRRELEGVARDALLAEQAGDLGHLAEPVHLLLEQLVGLDEVVDHAHEVRLVARDLLGVARRVAADGGAVGRGLAHRRPPAVARASCHRASKSWAFCSSVRTGPMLPARRASRPGSSSKSCSTPVSVPGSPARKVRPFTPSFTSSARPPTSDAITGRPAEKASSTTKGVFSYQTDGTTSTSMLDSASVSSPCP